MTGHPEANHPGPTSRPIPPNTPPNVQPNPDPPAAPTAAPPAPEQGERAAAQSGGGRGANLLRSGALMALGTVFSRITGFLRTAVLGAAIGTAALGDAYNTANTIPVIVYDLLLGGILTAVVVPLIVRAKERDAKYGARFEQRLFTLAVLGLVMMTAVAVLLAPIFIDYVYARDFSGDKRDLAVLFTRLFAVQIFFLGISAFAGAILNTRDRFAAPMWAPVLNNIVICCTGVLFILVTTGTVTPESITSGQVAILAGGTIGGIAMQTLALWPSLRGSGFRWRPRLDFQGGELRQIMSMAGWSLLYLVATQTAFAVTTSLLNAAGDAAPGHGYSPYSYAYQLFQLPYAIIGVTVITALLPRMSSHAAEGRTALVRDDFSSGLRLASVIILPAAALMVVLGPEIIAVTLEHGEIDRDAGLVIAHIMQVFAVALVPFAAYQLTLRVFYAHNDTRTPAFIVLAVIATNITVAVTASALLDPERVAVAIAGGFALAQTVGLLVSWLVLRRKLGGIDGRRIVGTHVKLLVAICPLAGFAYAVQAIVDAWLGPGFAPALLSLIVGGAGGGILYLVFARLLRVAEVQTMLSTVTRRLPGRG
ncbi:murein biosynthesis integral membrane protein MurJ [Thermomonospora cellulosilytica]|uniref:Putative peptidoglycan lipid II flippase n=1 Tax=Thermomonospora cellulosilytica TaxID=1411118 RepID=A0A7W3MUF8_9ACTN|nr:murein biosynthesis integral membrane protein MurJ [Thermomonospora cellulosilytica]MBA9002127.1 putative peptidoglycan lipid II flippase [Thermomonospora cellulosilytica]